MQVLIRNSCALLFSQHEQKWLIVTQFTSPIGFTELSKGSSRLGLILWPATNNNSDRTYRISMYGVRKL